MKILLTLLLTASLIGSGEWAFKSSKEQSTMMVLGTSTVHEWESEVNNFTVAGVMNDVNITNLNVEVVVSSIKSGKSIMDDKTYDALKGDEFDKIIFSADKLNVSGDDISGQGTLQLAGVSKSISITAKKVGSTASSATIKGAVELDMTDYGIEPPTAMFGTLETGEKVTIEYQLLLNK